VLTTASIATTESTEMRVSTRRDQRYPKRYERERREEREEREEERKREREREREKKERTAKSCMQFYTAVDRIAVLRDKTVQQLQKYMGDHLQIPDTKPTGLNIFCVWKCVGRRTRRFIFKKCECSKVTLCKFKW